MDAINNSKLTGAAADMLKQRYSDCLEISRLEKEAEATGKQSSHQRDDGVSRHCSVPSPYTNIKLNGSQVPGARVLFYYFDGRAFTLLHLL